VGKTSSNADFEYLIEFMNYGRNCHLAEDKLGMLRTALLLER